LSHVTSQNFATGGVRTFANFDPLIKSISEMAESAGSSAGGNPSARMAWPGPFRGFEVTAPFISMPGKTGSWPPVTDGGYGMIIGY
jgi:hypothetical protein